MALNILSAEILTNNLYWVTFLDNIFFCFILGNILVCDNGNHRVQVFDNEGKLISLFGQVAFGAGAGPMDVTMTSSGSVVVVDGSIWTGWSRVREFQY